MWAKTITGTMARRLLVNWRIPLDAARRALPARVRPSAINGHAIAGLCLVRLTQMRFPGMPAWAGLASENLAIRMGVEWDAPQGLRKAVLIFRRETGSAVNAFVGARIRFGIHHRGTFHVHDDGTSVAIRARGTNYRHSLSVRVRPADHIPATSIFDGMPQVETFFRSGECGYSPAAEPGMWDGIRLRLHHWDLQPMEIGHARSSLMDDLFDGQARVDSAYIMRNIEHTWTAEESVRLGATPENNAAAEAPGHVSALHAVAA